MPSKPCRHERDTSFVFCIKPIAAWDWLRRKGFRNVATDFSSCECQYLVTARPVATKALQTADEQTFNVSNPGICASSASLRWKMRWAWLSWIQLPFLSQLIGSSQSKTSGAFTVNELSFESLPHFIAHENVLGSKYFSVTFLTTHWIEYLGFPNLMKREDDKRQVSCFLNTKLGKILTSF